MLTTENRRVQERRRPPEFSDWRWMLGGRRRRARRSEDRSTKPLDWHPPALLGVVVLILGLSTLDATFTLALIETGIAREANPFMAALMERDIRLFVLLKNALTGSCIVLLVLYAQSPVLGRLRAGHCLYGIAAGYLGLVFYEIELTRLL